MPEVEALAGFLRERALGRAVTSARVAAIAALKTFDPPLHAIEGRPISAIRRPFPWTSSTGGSWTATLTETPYSASKPVTSRMARTASMRGVESVRRRAAGKK